jgi:predicted dehydrogenase
MRFAILGNDPDGVAMAGALAESGRHQLLAYTAPVPAEELRRWGPTARLVPDLEEILADPDIDAVIVAGRAVNRPTQLRRALQSERPVLCAHPADHTPDTAYEAAMIQRDTGRALLPLLPEALHPAVARLADLCRPGAPDGVGGIKLVEAERWSPDAVLLADEGGRKPALPGWDVLRRLGGEVAEVTAFAEREELTPDAPIFLSGRFEQGGLFRASYLPRQAGPRWRLTVTGEAGRAELTFPHGWPGPAVLTWQDADGLPHEQTWEPWDPWRALVEVFEAATAPRGQTGALPEVGPAHAPGGPREAVQSRRPGSGAAAPEAITTRNRVPAAAWKGTAGRRPPLTWQDEVRCLELDDAARRSAERRRATTLEYPDATEEAGVKGTMTLVGCGLLWLVLLLAVASAWVPWLGWAILPVLFLFLALQVFLWAVGRADKTPSPPGGEPPPEEG